MIEIAKKLSKDFPMVRVDLYNTDGHIYVGELTFLPGNAVLKYDPIEWDYKLGEYLDLTKISQEHLRILPEFAQKAKTFIDPEIVDKCTVQRIK